ncbi:HAD family hydrolase [Chamaesiphon minutus]|uniref:Haloacid dehalogenase superfamily protein, subfamily IA, variant 3 with third motif having DD or ED n=1 Tax=Chamaesiphon minutus (strain ATCC 27169 / PCC 6605) TaxID=1173020 RepID=K9UI26_CHAP6|nr:HAD family phosphatase [Chamaesiphon minutus]AFY94278.1 haloacid dehalogenase superfamily protein, subfamily IA, variant 3 with third motif having DD or ED [Chamaesiphon minutus PCC 6605]
MVLKAVLFDFNGVIIKDEAIHRELNDELLIGENLPPQGKEFWRVCVGRSDRAGLTELLKLRGRFVTDEYLDKLIAKKAIAYRQKLEQLETLPIYPDVVPFIEQMYNSQYKLAIVTGAIRSEVELVVQQARIGMFFDTIVAGDDVSQSKPDPEGYLLAVERLNKLHPDLNLLPSECLAIEDTFAGIDAVKAAGIQAAAIAHTYPFHMLQRRANWTFDTFGDLEFDRVTKYFESGTSKVE